MRFDIKIKAGAKVLSSIMQYNSFIQSSFSTIKKFRETGLNCKIIPPASRLPTEPQNLYIELLAEKNKQIYKIEQWNFKCLKTLVQSEYESNQDSELDSVELSKKSYSSILEQSLLKFNPKLLIKTLQPEMLIIRVVSSQKQLKPFSDEDVCLISIDQYEGNGFNCRITLKTIHTEMNRKKQEMCFQSSDEEFQVLKDSAYERQLQMQLEKQRAQQKMIKQPQKINSEKPLINQPQPKKIESIRDSANLNINISKYSTKEITVSQFQRKMQIVNETIDLIEDLNSEGQTLGAFLHKIQ